MSQREFFIYLRNVYDIPLRGLIRLELSNKNDLVISSEICEFLAYVSNLHIEIRIIPESSETRLISLETGRILAVSLPLIFNYLRVRAYKNTLTPYFYGKNIDEVRNIRRGLITCRCWESDWSNLTDCPQDQMRNPLCKARLLDRNLRHQRLRYILDNKCGATGQITNNYPSIVDVYLLSILTNWLGTFSSFAEYLIFSIPAVVSYAQRIRKDLCDLNLPSQFKSFRFLQPIPWVEKAQIPFPFHAFRYTPSKEDKLILHQIKKSQNKNKILPKSLINDSQTPDDPAASESEVASTDSTLIINSDTKNDEISAASLQLLVDWSVCDDQKSSLQKLIHYLPSSHIDTTQKETSLVTPSSPPFEYSEIFWSLLNLPPGRVARKRQQVESLVRIAATLLPVGGTAVEFCAGGGYIGLALAWARPDATVWLTDMNAISLAFASQRAATMNLTNIRTKQSELTELEEEMKVVAAIREGRTTFEAASPLSLDNRMLLDMHLGIALHACGPATDVVQHLCLANRASFVLSPCCYGFLQHWAEECHKSLSFPRSAAFAKAGCTQSWFSALCSCADRTFWSHDSRATHNAAGQSAMRAIDTDRLLAAQERGYAVRPMLMTPPEASPKNHILVGYPTCSE